MWHLPKLKQNALHAARSRFRRGLWLLLIPALLLAACGGASTNGSSVPLNAPARSSSGDSGSASAPSSGKQTGANYGQQYLIKSLQVSMLLKNTRQVASDLQAWITTTDPQATSAGIDYQQSGDTLYTINMSFSVQSTLYPQIENYLANYAQQRGGKLLNLHENVQDVTNDYIDTQSRLTNLRGEQTRLLTLMKNAQALSDILAIEQQLTNVEGQIENIEAHLKVLQGQVTFYTVSIQLQPMELPAPTQNTPWNPGRVFQDAWAAVLVVGQALLTFLIWVLSFAIYIVPLAAIAWFVWWRRSPRRIRPAVATPGSGSPPAP